VDCEEEEEHEQEPSQDENVEEISPEDLPRYRVMHWLELALLKPSRSKDTSKRKS
jgi:hypothetical protein